MTDATEPIRPAPGPSRFDRALWPYVLWITEHACFFLALVLLGATPKSESIGWDIPSPRQALIAACFMGLCRAAALLRRRETLLGGAVKVAVFALFAVSLQMVYEGMNTSIMAHAAKEVRP